MRHYYNETDKVVAQAKRFQESDGVHAEGNVDFSSPYRVKVVKEVEKQRMEEVDLDTGKRRSWVETKEYDVYDLTGDTPAKPKPPLMDKTNKVGNLITNLAKANMMADTSSVDKPPISSTPIARKVSSLADKENIGSEDTDVNVDDKTCPVCHRLFKNARGVKSHRNHKNSQCKVEKENLEKSNLSPINHASKEPPQVRALPSVRPLPSLSNMNTSDSVIVIADTPEVPASRRRSTRPRP